MKKIWLINQYNMPPEYGHLNRHYNLAKYLERLGHEPTVLVGSFLHNTGIQMIRDRSVCLRYEGCSFPCYFIRTCSYAGSRVKRVFAMAQFYLNVMRTARRLEPPDVVLGSSAHPLAALAAIRLGRRYGCLAIVEVRDLWPESFAAYGILSRRNPLMKLFYAGEKWLYRKAGAIVFTMEGGKDYILAQGWDSGHGGPIDMAKVHHLNNGVDLEAFISDRETHTLRDADLDDTDTFKVVYTGSIRLVNDVGRIVDAAAHLQRQGHGDIRFLIYGEGGDREALEKQCADQGITNVRFKGFVDKKFIPFILSRSDLNILHFKDSPLKKYGASLNKLFEYFASGKPTLSDCAFGYDLIARYGCGITEDRANAAQLADAVLRFRDMPRDEYAGYCANALRAAADYDFKVLARKFEEIFL